MSKGARECSLDLDRIERGESGVGSGDGCGRELGFLGWGDKGSGVAGWAFWAGGLLASWAIRPGGGGGSSLFSFV